MKAKNSIQIALTVFLTVTSLLSAFVGADIVQPSGINPATGVAWVPDNRYRLVFISSTIHSAESSDIEHYQTI